jgi:hexosaminidase
LYTIDGRGCDESRQQAKSQQEIIMRRLSALGLIAVLSLAGALGAQETPGPNLMPIPAETALSQGRLTVDGSFSVALTGYQEPRLQRAVHRFLARLAAQTGIPVAEHPQSSSAQATLVIQCDHAGEAVQSMQEDESYTLEVAPQRARLTAATPVGVMRGLATFLQLVDLNAQGFGVPAVSIHDRPRFQWRGLMIDVSPGCRWR